MKGDRGRRCNLDTAILVADGSLEQGALTEHCLPKVRVRGPFRFAPPLPGWWDICDSITKSSDIGISRGFRKFQSFVIRALQVWDPESLDHSDQFLGCQESVSRCGHASIYDDSVRVLLNTVVVLVLRFCDRNTVGVNGCVHYAGKSQKFFLGFRDGVSDKEGVARVFWGEVEI